HAEPYQVDSQLVRNRTDQGNHNERKLEKVEKKCQHENEDVDDDQEAELTAGQMKQEVLDPHVSVDAVEREAEHPRAEENEHDECRQFCSRIHRLPEKLPRNPAARK